MLGDRYPHLRDLLEVLFIPQVGFLIALTESSDLIPENVNVYVHERDGGFVPDDMTFIFQESGKAFFKNADMRELDMKIGDLDAFIKDTEALIVAELEDDILDIEHELRSTFNVLAEMDCILAFASSALDSNYVRPQIVPADENCILIQNGRHPLQEIITETKFIANHTKVERTSNRVNIITGPNFSGKSCYARQVGVLVLMAHIGCFLPCDEARISITDQILARFSTIETCSVPQSSFQLDLTKMGSILRRATPHSLVLIDEFGKGTSPASGIALLTAALRRLVSIQCKVICTTHFLEIFSLGFVHDGHDGIKALQMTVLRDCVDLTVEVLRNK
jgi:DNA mismatch repair protein MSH5